jgi:ABC-type Mn2+/Zn2+ transport system permease subunit
VLRTFYIYLVIAGIHVALRKQFIRLSFHPTEAAGSGMRIRAWDFLFYCLFGIVVTSFVQIGGVLLTFSYLIVPAVCATFIAQRLATRLVFGWLVATISSIAALYLSYRLDLPTGAAVVCVLGAALLLTMGVSAFRKG